MSACCNDENTIATIRKKYYHPDQESKRSSYLLDPHTAVGVYAASKVRTQLVDEYATPFTSVCLSTAHPAKFVETVSKAP